jgi:hypothetical protein
VGRPEDRLPARKLRQKHCSNTSRFR